MAITRVQHSIVPSIGTQANIVCPWGLVPAKNYLLNPTMMLPANNQLYQEALNWTDRGEGSWVNRFMNASELAWDIEKQITDVNIAQQWTDDPDLRSESHDSGEPGYFQYVYTTVDPTQPGALIPGETYMVSAEFRIVNVTDKNGNLLLRGSGSPYPASDGTIAARVRMHIYPQRNSNHMSIFDSSQIVGVGATSVPTAWTRVWTTPVTLPSDADPTGAAHRLNCTIRTRFCPYPMLATGESINFRLQVRNLTLEQVDPSATEPTVWEPPTTTAGNLLVMAYTVRNTAGLSVTPPSGWTLVPGTNPVTNANNVTTALYYIENAAARSGSEVLLFDSARDAIVSLAEYSGVELAAALDQHQSATGNAATQRTGLTGTTTQADELAVGVVAARAQNIGTHDTSTGFTLINQDASNNSTKTIRVTHAFAEKIMSATGTAEYLNTSGTQNRQYAGKVATFKASSGVIAPSAGSWSFIPI